MITGRMASARSNVCGCSTCGSSNARRRRASAAIACGQLEQLCGRQAIVVPVQAQRRRFDAAQRGAQLMIAFGALVHSRAAEGPSGSKMIVPPMTAPGGS